MAGALIAGTTSCNKKGCTDPTATNYDEKAKKDDGSCDFAPEVEDENTVTKSGAITADETWTSDKCYLLDGRVYVDNGATLTIEAGTVIKGKQGTGTNASALIIARDAKIMAQGTASSPIIFTSELDNIDCDQTGGGNLDENDAGKWGGLIVLGNARISAENGDTESQIEGIPVTEAYGTFGGNDDADNSGVITYVSIRHGGALIGAGNEINGLTLGGVGNGTTINHVEVIGNLDDGIEFFGGSVNVDNAVVGYQGDDGIDIDMNYSGTVTNFVVLGGTLSDEALEIDGPEGSTYNSGLFSLVNGSIISVSGAGSGGDFKSKAQGNVSNVYWEGYSAKSIKIRASYSDTTACTDKEDSYSHLTDLVPTLTFVNAELVGSATVADQVDVYTTSSVLGGCVDGAVETAAETAVNPSVVVTATVGADITGFGWTWASANGKL